MDEIEIKILEINVENLRSILKKNKAKFVKKVFQKNMFYANEHTRKIGAYLRIRREGNNAFLTVKEKKRIVNNHVIRAEHEMPVDFETTTKIVELLGLSKVGISEVKREYWSIYGCSVEFCHIPGVPIFLEIEGNEKNIQRVAKLLGYSKKDYFTGFILKRYGITSKNRVFK